MLFTPIDVSAVVGGGAATLSTEKDCILTEYLAWHAGATFVYNYGLRTRSYSRNMEDKQGGSTRSERS